LLLQSEQLSQILCDEISAEGCAFPCDTDFLWTMIRKSKVFPTASHSRSGSESSCDVWMLWIGRKFCTRTQVIGDRPEIFAKENWEF